MACDQVRQKSSQDTKWKQQKLDGIPWHNSRKLFKKASTSEVNPSQYQIQKPPVQSSNGKNAITYKYLHPNSGKIQVVELRACNVVDLDPPNVELMLIAEEKIPCHAVHPPLAHSLPIEPRGLYKNPMKKNLICVSQSFSRLVKTKNAPSIATGSQRLAPHHQ